MKLILGGGKTAHSIARFLQKKAIDFQLIEDTRKPQKSDILQAVSEVFVSPGIPQTDAIIAQARQKHIPVVSDIALFGRYAKAPIIGITGSNGKSTVTQLLGEMIAKDGHQVAIGGNIGTPALDLLDDAIDFYVLELSSYQLDYTQALALLTGVVLNITPDHLDRYDDFEHYKRAKLSLYSYCQNPVFNLDEPHTPDGIGFSLNIPKHDYDFGTVTCHGSCYFLYGDDVLMDTNEAQLIGEHSKSNILAAFALGHQTGLSVDAMVQAVKQFTGLPHRLEWVGHKQGVDYYNDSKATNAIATITAISALSTKYKTICLIMGGIQKTEDYQALFDLIDANIAHAILIGQDAQSIAKGIHKATTTHAKSMQEAVKLARNTQPEAVLLSPACASFDMFENFEHRGRAFKECIHNQA